MATAHKVLVLVKNKRGQVKGFPYSTTDINAAFFLTPSGGSQIVFSDQDCWIIDIVHSTQGSTTKDYIFFNNVKLSDEIQTPAAQPNVNRQISPRSPIFVPGGTQVKFQSIT